MDLKLIIGGLLATFTLTAYADQAVTKQDSTSSAKEKTLEQDQLFEIVEEMANFPGGMAAMMQFIARNLVYPKEAMDYGIEGTVVIEFIVEKNGSLSNYRILRDIGGGCGEAVIDVFKLMPLWEPAKQRDKPVRLKMKAPVKFKLSTPPPTSE
jgi:periplasmic protein TonB